MSEPFKITIQSSAPEIVSCEVFLSGGQSSYETGWMVTKFVSGILKTGKVVSSIALNPPNIQVSATLDTTKEHPRIAVLVGIKNPMDRKVVEISNQGGNGGHELTVFWNNWIIGDVKWSGESLRELEGY